MVVTEVEVRLQKPSMKNNLFPSSPSVCFANNSDLGIPFLIFGLCLTYGFFFPILIPVYQSLRSHGEIRIIFFFCLFLILNVGYVFPFLDSLFFFFFSTFRKMFS